MSAVFVILSKIIHNRVNGKQRERGGNEAREKRKEKSKHEIEKLNRFTFLPYC